MGSVSSKKWGDKYFLWVTNIFIKYAWVKTLTYKNAKIVLDAFSETVNESNCKLNNLWIDQESEFYFWKNLAIMIF